MNRFLAKNLACLLSLAIGFPVYAQVGKQIVKPAGQAMGAAAGEFSVLKTMDGWYNSGAALRRSAAESVERTLKKEISMQQDRNHAFRNSYFFRPILPTPIRDLRINLIHPSTEQVQQAVSEYRKIVTDFNAMRREVSTKVFYKTFPNDEPSAMAPQELRQMIIQLSDLQFKINRLRRIVFAKDPALAQMAQWTEQALRQVNPFYMPGLQQRARLDSRVFDRNEFFLKYPNSANVPEGITPPQRMVPDNLRVAVLNDQPDILNMYRAWADQKRLGAGWSVITYKDTGDLLNALRAGEMYDLIITDLTVPGGGGYFLTDQVREMNLNIPIIGCSMYTVDKLNAEKMFEQGFDGYIYGDDMFEEMAGSVSWIGYIKNYYYYKALHGWSR